MNSTLQHHVLSTIDTGTPYIQIDGTFCFAQSAVRVPSGDVRKLVRYYSHSPVTQLYSVFFVKQNNNYTNYEKTNQQTWKG